MEGRKGKWRGRWKGREKNTSHLCYSCLFSRIPTSTSSKLSLGSLRRGDTSSEMCLNRDDLLAACCLLCTADYCLETTQQLQAKLQEKIDVALKERVDFTQEEECFRK